MIDSLNMTLTDRLLILDVSITTLIGTLTFQETHLPEMLRLGRCRLVELVVSLVEGSTRDEDANHLDVQLFSLVCALHDESEPRRGVLAHQLVDHAIRPNLVGYLDAKQTARARIERGFPQHLRHHLAEAFESRNF